MPIGSVEIELTAGSDFVLLPNGDLSLVADSLNAPSATTQRLIRLILTNARVTDATTGVTSMPDDVFNPTWGATIRPLVGAPIDSNLTSLIQSQIQHALAVDPDTASIPAPVVTVTQSTTNPAMVIVSVQCNALTGELITIPSLSIPITGA